MTSLSSFHCQRQSLAEGKSVLRLSGELDLFAVSRFQQEWQAVLSEGCRELYVDLGDLQFIDSAGLAALLILYRESLGQDCSLVLVDDLGRQERLFALTHLESILPLQRAGVPVVAAS
jgi:anti-sigma B factor antagonist